MAKQGRPFAVSLLAILAAHEFGHYLMGRYHGVHVTLPYFIPMPFSQIGTMGAFINMKEPPKNRKVLLDIGIAGPLAGLAVAIRILILGLYLSKVEALPLQIAPNTGLQLEGNSILYLFLKFAMFGWLLPAPQIFWQPARVAVLAAVLLYRQAPTRWAAQMCCCHRWRWLAGRAS